jgi:S-adenosylmethionine decarboxylase
LTAAVGVEWIVEAAGCDPAPLRDVRALEALFSAILDAARLTAVAPAVWHCFPSPGGVTGLQVLAESHLACHTFPEHASLCLNVFCCVAREEWDVDGIVRRSVGAQEVRVRRIERQYGVLVKEMQNLEFRIQTVRSTTDVRVGRGALHPDSST